MTDALRDAPSSVRNYTKVPGNGYVPFIAGRASHASGAFRRGGPRKNRKTKRMRSPVRPPERRPGPCVCEQLWQASRRSRMPVNHALARALDRRGSGSCERRARR